MSNTPQHEPLLTPAEVANAFRVDPKTVTRWAKAGRLTVIWTLGGHRRYREAEVRALIETPVERPAQEQPAQLVKTPKLEVVAEPASPAEWRAGLFGKTVTVEGDAIVYRDGGTLTKFKDDFPDGIDLQRMAENLAQASGCDFIEAAS